MVGEVRPGRKLAEHPVVILVGVLASIVTIVAFFSTRNGHERQASAPDVLDLRQGTWTLVDTVDAGNTHWSGSVLRITEQQPVEDGLAVAGYFEWRREGTVAGTEQFTGTYRAASRQLFLEGKTVTSVNDGSGRRIVPGSYSAVLSGDGRRLNEGRWGNVPGAEMGVPGRWQAFR